MKDYRMEGLDKVYLLETNLMWLKLLAIGVLEHKKPWKVIK